MTRQSVGVALKDGSAKAANFVATRPDWIIDSLSRMNMTNLRAIVTMGLAIWTAWRYFNAKLMIWEPSIEWLGFLVALGGLDVAQFSVKRRTHVMTGSEAQSPKPDSPDA